MLDRLPALAAALLLALVAQGSIPSLGARVLAQEPDLPGQGVWDQYRGDPANQGVSHSRRPDYEGTGEGDAYRPFGLKWKYFLGGGTSSTPAFADGKVVVCTETGVIHVVDAATGKKVWVHRIGAEKRSGFSFSSPLIREGRIYIGSKDGHLYCVDLANGEVQWSFDAESPIYSSPKGDQRGLVFGTSEGWMTCVDPATGTLRWRFRADREVGAAAAVWGDQLLMPAKDRLMYRVDYADGRIVEEIPLPGSTHCSPCLGMGYAFLIVGGRKSTAIDLLSSEVAWEGMATGDTKTPCAYHDRRAYLPLGKYVYCVNGATGEKYWQAEAGHKVTAPLINSGEFLFTAKDGVLRVHDRLSGAELVTVELGEAFVSGPILVDGTVYLAGSKSYLYAVE